MVKRFAAAMVLLASTIFCTVIPSAPAQAAEAYFGPLTTIKSGTNTLCPSGYKKRFVVIGTIQSDKNFTQLYAFNLYTRSGRTLLDAPTKVNNHTVKYVFNVGRYTRVSSNKQASWTNFYADSGAIWHATVSKRCYR